MRKTKVPLRWDFCYTSKMDSKLKLYISTSLTWAEPEYTEKIKTFKDSLKGEYEVMEFLGLGTGSPQEVYERDIQECIAGCDLVLAFCDYPSIGLGYELGTAVEKYSKPVLAVAQIESKVTRLIEGVTHPMYNFARYSDISEVSNLLTQKVQKFFPKLEPAICETDVCAV